MDVLKPNLMLMISIIKKSVYCIKVLILPFNLIEIIGTMGHQYILSMSPSIDV